MCVDQRISGAGCLVVVPAIDIVLMGFEVDWTLPGFAIATRPKHWILPGLFLPCRSWTLPGPRTGLYRAS
jgi:hypothetical protein